MKPERKAQLDAYAERHGQDAVTALDDALAEYFAWEQQDYREGYSRRLRRYESRSCGAHGGFWRPARMRMAFRVELTATAKQNARDILAWLHAQHAGEAGLRWFQGMQKSIASLSELPTRCAFAPENKAFPLKYANYFTAARVIDIESFLPIENDTSLFCIFVMDGVARLRTDPNHELTGSRRGKDGCSEET